LNPNLVSIITPAYNAEDYIVATIESVLAQSDPHWELLIVDDCSKDQTRDRVKEYSQKDSRVKLIEASQNGGPARARNLGLRAAQGTYLAFLDADDPSYLKLNYSALSSSGESQWI